MSEQAVIHFETLGCRLNQDESEGAARFFLQNNFICESEPVTSKTKTDEKVIVCILNTCTVTSKAEQKARRIIRLLLEKYPCCTLIVTGCYAAVSSDEIKQINPERIAVLSGQKKYLLASIAHYIKASGSNDITASQIEKLIHSDSQDNFSLNRNISCTKKQTDIPNAFTLFTPVFQKHSRASLKIQDGCNNSCAFCKIHFARGKSVSIPVNEAVERAVLLEKNGAEEIVLTGVNLSQYSGKLNDESEECADFANLLKELLEKTEKVTYRISSFYPQSITPELCNVLKNERVMPFFHLSIQSGSNEILHKMNRPYDMNTVINAVNLLRESKDNPFISCDIIAGFPGETENDFKQTQELCNECNFSWIHAFPFSPRPGTAAQTLKPQIPERIKDERVAWLTQKAVEGKLNYINYWKDKKLSAVVENPRSERIAKTDSEKHNKYRLHCVTDNFIHVEFISESIIPSGTRINVKIDSACEEYIHQGKETEAFGKILI